MNRYLGNICISAVSAVAGGTIAHLTDAQIIKNLENQNEKLEEKNIKYKLHIIKLNKIISYYETKYNEKVEITVDGKLKSNLDTVNEDPINENLNNENPNEESPSENPNEESPSENPNEESPSEDSSEDSISEDSSEENLIKKLADDCNKGDKNAIEIMYETPPESPESDDESEKTDESNKTDESKNSFESLDLEELKNDLIKES